MTDERKEYLKKLAEVLRKTSVELADEKKPENQRSVTALQEGWAALLELIGEPLEQCGNENCKLHYPNSRCSRAGDKYGAKA